MARSRSRRTHRRSASQTAASLLALALPAPVQRIADTRLGPLLMLVGIPTAIVFGLINIDWNGGKPSLSIDKQRAAEIRNVARDQYNNFESHGGLQNLGQAATEMLSQAQNYASQNHSLPGFTNSSSNQPTGYSQPNTFNQSQPTAANRNSSAAFPSTQPAQQRSQQQVQPNSQAVAQQTAQQTAQPDWRNYSPSTVTQNASTYNTAGTNPVYSPSDTRTLTYQQQEQLHQQQLYQQQLYQQQLYDQQLKQYQYQQWLAQQNTSQQNTAQQAGPQPYAAQPSAGYAYPQTDAYGRPVTTGYPTATSPQSQYGQQTAQPNTQPNYNQGSLPTASTRGRY